MAENTILDFSEMTIGESFYGLVCVKSLTIDKTRTGNAYIKGICIYQKTTVQVKIWDRTVVLALKPYIEAETGWKPMVARVTGEVRNYQGNADYTISAIQLIPDADITPFMPTLNVEDIYGKITNFINTHLSAEWITALMIIMDIKRGFFGGKTPDNYTGADTDSLLKILKTAWGASGNHDAITGGLMNHTYKMLRIAETIVDGNELLTKNKDLLYAGVFLHDVGKMQEMVDGCYQKNSFVSHRVMGIEYLASVKPALVQQIGIDAYYRLASIIVGHHDQYGTPADTIWAYLVHLIDMVDTYATMFNEQFQNDTAATNPTGERIFYKDGAKLFY